MMSESRRASLLCLVSLLTFSVTAAGKGDTFDQADPLGDDRGAHFAVTLTGSELDAPKQTVTTDLELFTGLGLSLAGGYRFGRFRIEGEWHIHHSERGFTGDTVGLRASMVNGYADFRLSEKFAGFLGAGLGNASVDVEFDTCLDVLGCPALSFIDTSTSATASQYMIGFGYSPSPSNQYVVGFRMFRTADLGLRDTLGTPFSDDHVKMPMAIIGFTKRFQKS